MPRVFFIILCCLLGLGVPKAFGQFGETPIKTFGYFQTLFQHQQATEATDTDNSFSIQQLNLFFQTDLSPRWRAFINFEVLNNFSSSRRWGSFDLDEAWVRYRANRSFILKAGLHVPTFNRLNEIKNRTPLLPYVVRPLIYEESFAEFIQIEEFVPDRAFVQVEGTARAGTLRLDYAAYLGNSPEINSQFDNEREGAIRQTGVDTTTTVLVGGRAGLRYGPLELGVSATRETVNFFRDLALDRTGDRPPLVPEATTNQLEGVPKTRLGVDLALTYGRLSFEGELIAVRHAVDEPPALAPLDASEPPRIDLDRTFYYGTLGYEVAERLFVYGSYWYTEQGLLLRVLDREYQDLLTVDVWTVGAKYTLLQDREGFDRLTLKAQYAYVRIDAMLLNTAQRIRLDQNNTVNIVGLALSVLF